MRTTSSTNLFGNPQGSRNRYDLLGDHDDSAGQADVTRRSDNESVTGLAYSVEVGSESGLVVVGISGMRLKSYPPSFDLAFIMINKSWNPF